MKMLGKSMFGEVLPEQQPKGCLVAIEGGGRKQHGDQERITSKEMSMLDYEGL